MVTIFVNFHDDNNKDNKYAYLIRHFTFVKNVRHTLRGIILVDINIEEILNSGLIGDRGEILENIVC